MNKTKQLSEGPGSFNVATGALEGTPSDTEDLKVTAVCRYLWVGVAGNIAHEVVYTSSAFTDGPGADFSLNGTTGGGADLKQLAYPVAFGSATANKRDIGAVQSVGTGGSSSTYVVNPGFLGSRSL